MSAYMVRDETINRVITWLSWEINRSDWLKKKVSDELRLDTTKADWEEILGLAMFQLNIAGVNERYGGGAQKFRKLNYRYSPAHGSQIQVLKSMQCWLYQCMEGEVVKNPLYQFFDSVIAPYLMSSIISICQNTSTQNGAKRKTGEEGTRAPLLSVLIYTYSMPVTLVFMQLIRILGQP
jgi:hypothetical protein